MERMADKNATHLKPVRYIVWLFGYLYDFWTLNKQINALPAQ